MVEIEEDEAERIHRVAILQILEQTLLRELDSSCVIDEFNFNTPHPSISVLSEGSMYRFGFDQHTDHSLHLEAWPCADGWDSNEAVIASRNIVTMIRRGVTFRGIRY